MRISFAPETPVAIATFALESPRLFVESMRITDVHWLGSKLMLP
jgi:hypothetical protein